MKKLVMALALTLASTSVFASEGKASLTIEGVSDTLYRGQSFSNGNPAVAAKLRVYDLVTDGTFATVTGTTLDLGNLDKNGEVRTEYEVGYGRNFGGLSLVGSVAHVQNPVLYNNDYTEARVASTFALTDKLSVTGQYAQILTNSIGQDRYASVGLEYNGFVLNKLTVGGLVSYQDYKKANRSELNNAEVYATYSFNSHVEAFGVYSWGGKSVSTAVDALDVDFNHSNLTDQGQVGIRLRF